MSCTKCKQQQTAAVNTSIHINYSFFRWIVFFIMWGFLSLFGWLLTSLLLFNLFFRNKISAEDAKYIPAIMGQIDNILLKIVCYVFCVFVAATLGWLFVIPTLYQNIIVNGSNPNTI